jgi:tripartite-type tricarboxylate transporter receptor subunit TctC
LIAATVAGSALPAAGQQYPVKPIRIIVPLAPGGPTDLLARIVGQKLTEAWGQQVLVDSRAGANGALGSELVARSTPDGYTLLMGTSATHGINASLYPKLPYDTLKDFAPIARVGIAPYVLVAHPPLPARSAKELIQIARARPGQVTCAFGGSASQLAAELFKSTAHIDLLIVPYKGNAPAVAAVFQRTMAGGGPAIGAAGEGGQAACVGNDGPAPLDCNARGADHSRLGFAGIRSLNLVWPVGACGHCAAYRRSAQQRDRKNS